MMRRQCERGNGVSATTVGRETGSGVSIKDFRPRDWTLRGIVRQGGVAGSFANGLGEALVHRGLGLYSRAESQPGPGKERGQQMSGANELH